MPIDLKMKITDLLEQNPEEFDHAGVKGMKWGVRRSEKELAAARGKAAGEASLMSDAELRSKISRIQMERQYVDLIAPLPKTSAKGNNFAKDLIANTAKQVAQDQAKKYAQKGAEVIISGAISKTTGVRVNAPKHRK